MIGKAGSRYDRTLIRNLARILFICQRQRRRTALIFQPSLINTLQFRRTFAILAVPRLPAKVAGHPSLPYRGLFAAVNHHCLLPYPCGSLRAVHSLVGKTSGK